MGYRDECLQRIAAARIRIDDALRTEANAAVLLETWHLILDELKHEEPSEADRLWLADRIDDLRVHVHNSPRWRQVLERSDPASRSEAPPD